MSYVQQHDGEKWKWHDSAEGASRLRVDGGWIYNAFGGPVFVPEFEAGELVATEPVRDDRRLKLREGYESHDSNGVVTVWRNSRTRKSVISECFARALVIAFHADGSETDHATRLEAHDALIASGSESPFVVVAGVVAKAKVDGGAA